MKGLVVVGVVAVAAASAGFLTRAWSIEAGPEVSTVYTVNYLSDSVSARAAVDLTQIGASDIPVAVFPRAVTCSPDGARVYTGNSDGTVTPIDAATNAPLASVALGDYDDFVLDIVVSPDSSTLYGTLTNSNAVVTMNTTTLEKADTFPIDSISSNSPRPSAIDISPDGAFLYVLNSADSQLVKMQASNGATPRSVPVASDAVELKVSADGGTVVVVGDDAPQFFSASTLAPIAGASSDDFGTQVDLDVAGTRVYVLNQFFAQAGAELEGEDQSGAKPGPKGGAVLGPTIDVYEAATGVYVESIPLGGGVTYLGIAVLSDASTAFVSAVGGENAGSVTSVNLSTGVSGPTSSVGQNPVRVAVCEVAAPSTPVPPNFLPRRVVVKLNTESAGKDTLIASGFFDEGRFIPDYDQDVTVDVGGFTSTFRLTANKNRTAFRNGTRLDDVRFGIVPNLRGSSRGRFTMKLFKTTLAGLIDPDQPLDFRFRATGLPEARGRVELTEGRYRLNRAAGELIEPAFFPASVKAKLGDLNKDTLLFKGGFATSGPIPAALSTVRFAFGPAFSRTIAGDQFTKNAAGDVFKFVAPVVGKTKFSMTVNFLKELVTVSASNVELGALDAVTTDVLFDAGAGAGAYSSTIRLSKPTATRRGY